MYSLHFLPMISRPTRFDTTATNGTILDHIWINKIFQNNCGILNFDVTDHCPTFIQLLCCKNDFENTIKTISVRPYSDEKLNALKDELSHTNWDQIIGTEINDIEQSYCLFSNHINKLYLKHFPLKRKKNFGETLTQAMDYF